MSRKLSKVDRMANPKKRRHRLDGLLGGHEKKYYERERYHNVIQEPYAMRPSKVLCLDCLFVFQPRHSNYKEESKVCTCGSKKLVKLPPWLKIPKKNKNKEWAKIISNIEEIFKDELYMYKEPTYE